MEPLETRVAPSSFEARERFFEKLYEHAFPVFARFAGKMNASFDDAKDIFQDAMVVYCEKAGEPDFELRTTAEAYLLGIARNLWLKKFSRDRDNRDANGIENMFSVPADYFPDAREYSLLAFLELSGKRCMELLRKFYFEQSSMEKIATFLGYGNEHSAAVQKFKCIGKLRDAVREKSIEYEDFHF